MLILSQCSPLTPSTLKTSINPANTVPTPQKRYDLNSVLTYGTRVLFPKDSILISDDQRVATISEKENQRWLNSFRINGNAMIGIEQSAEEVLRRNRQTSQIVAYFRIDPSIIASQAGAASTISDEEIRKFDTTFQPAGPNQWSLQVASSVSAATSLWVRNNLVEITLVMTLPPQTEESPYVTK